MASGSARPRISLDNTAVIDLTPKSQRKKRVSKVSSGTRMDDGTNGDGGAKWQRVCPDAEDESNIIARLSGNTTSGFVELSAWSELTPLKFFNIYSTTQLTNMIDSDGNFIAAVERLKDHCITLRDMESMIPSGRDGYQRLVDTPVMVQVIGKRKIDVFAKGRKVNIICLLVVADASGYCVVCSFNEGVATIYNAVDIGDKLLITRCMPQRPYRTYHKGLFSEPHFLNMELKIQYHTARSHYIRKFNPRKLVDFKFPGGLFDNTTELMLPHELQNEFQLRELQPFILPREGLHYYNVVGVISYVSRIERFRAKGVLEMECLVDNEQVNSNVVRFISYRWIHLVDQFSKPLSVKIFVNNTNSHCQSTLVPGAIVIVSHCQTNEHHNFSNKFVETTAFSHIYIAGSMEKFCMMHPKTFLDKARKILLRENYLETLQRNDISWNIGGTQSFRIISEEKFLEFFRAMGHRTEVQYDAGEDIKRRQNRRISFEGYVLRAMEVKDDNFPMPIYHHPKYYQENNRKTDYKVVENFLTFEIFINSWWYSFIRKLPTIDPTILQEKQGRDIVNKVVNANKGYCKPLLIPAEMNNANELPTAAGLQRLDGPPYFLLDIVNKQTMNWYTCIWKSPEYAHTERLRKLNNCKNRKIYAVAELFCTEPDIPLELCLHDFVADKFESDF